MLRDHVEHLEDGKDRFIEVCFEKCFYFVSFVQNVRSVFIDKILLPFQTCEALRKENELLRDQIQELENEKEKYIQVGYHSCFYGNQA